MPKSIKRIHLLSHSPSSPPSLQSIHLGNSFNGNETRVQEFIRILRSLSRTFHVVVTRPVDRAEIHDGRVSFFSEGHQGTRGINAGSTYRGDDKRDDRLARKVACVSILWISRTGLTGSESFAIMAGVIRIKPGISIHRPNAMEPPPPPR